MRHKRSTMTESIIHRKDPKNTCNADFEVFYLSLYDRVPELDPLTLENGNIQSTSKMFTLELT